ncbi:hypothetical protein [Atlantibacter hermannii]|uniref:hypothetical protein n=1 Tax=Atlantibacter hermannii TaxID=565 RepID=UPI0029156337|nr:hypothetical protein [Atlantibacter hermannii]MDU7390285.1 hypothetical protein [Atlantibacter hermannii]
MLRAYFKLILLFTILISPMHSFGAKEKQKLVLEGDIPHAIIEWLKGFRGESITLENQVLTFVFKDEQVTDLMANTVATSVCNSRFAGGANAKWPQDTLNKVVVINHMQTQGFQYDIDAKACDEYGQMTGDEGNEFIKSKMNDYP